jgi:Family of unknown function (DUF6163)
MLNVHPDGRADERRTLEPVHADEAEGAGKPWARWLAIFLRVMAGWSLLKGLYHWAIICGINAPFPSGFEAYPVPYQVATVFFAIIDLVAGVGLWLAAPWGAVVWLTSVISMIAIEGLFPQIYGASILIIFFELTVLATYLGLVLLAAREQPD